MEGTSKTHLAKSKSSNSAIPPKSNQNEKRTNKKSKSNAHFQINVCKKRGVYVDNNLSKDKGAMVKDNISLQKNKSQENRAVCTAPPRPRPGKKRFLNSVLTILSKTTTGTQCTTDDKTDKKEKDVKSTTQRKLKRPLFEPNTLNNRDLCKQSMKSNKFKSKVLNKRIDSKENESLVYLQPKRDLIQTPSNFSEGSSKLSTISHMMYNKINSVNNVDASICSPIGNIAKEVLEGRNYNKTKNADSPATLVNNMQEKPQDDKQFYDFFVDLLETTFNVYNVKPKYDNLKSDVSSSKVSLEISESVAKKLNIRKENITRNSSNTSGELKQKTSSNFEDDEVLHWKDKKFQDYFTCHQPIKQFPPEKIQPKTYKKKIRSGSFIHPSSIPKAPEAHSLILNTKKKYSRKNRKRDLLNIFKEQLTMDVDVFDEPMNFYQSLKVMAKNKRKGQKSIKFDVPVKRKTKPGLEPECLLKRRKVLSKTKSKGKFAYNVDSDFPESLSKSSNSVFSNYSTNKSNKSEYATKYEVDNESLESLEVFGYDFEPTESKRRLSNRNKHILFTHDNNKTLDGEFMGANKPSRIEH